MSEAFKTAYDNLISAAEAEFEKIPVDELAGMLATCFGKDQYGFFATENGIEFEEMGTPTPNMYLAVGWCDEELNFENPRPEENGYGIIADDIGGSTCDEEVPLVISHVRFSEAVLKRTCELIEEQLSQYNDDDDDD